MKIRFILISKHQIETLAFICDQRFSSLGFLSLHFLYEQKKKKSINALLRCSQVVQSRDFPTNEQMVGRASTLWRPSTLGLVKSFSHKTTHEQDGRKTTLRTRRLL